MNMFTLQVSLSLVLLSVSVQSGFGSSWFNECNRPLGLQDRRVLDSQLSSPSFYELFYVGDGKTMHTKPDCARLNNTCAWCASGGRGYYIEVDLNQSVIISGIAVQGFTGINDYYVKDYKVVYSTDRVKWRTDKKVWPGNSDAQTVIKNTFSVPISARYLRVYPVSYNYNICLRMELYGCTNLTAATDSTISTPRASVPTAGSVKSTSLAPSNAMVTKAPLTGVASTEAVVVAATASAVGYNRSAPDTLVIGLIVSAILLLVVMVPVVMFAVFFCHHRRKRCISACQVGGDFLYEVPLATAVVNVGLCNQEMYIDEYSATMEKYSTDGTNLLSPGYAV